MHQAQKIIQDKNEDDDDEDQDSKSESQKGQSENEESINDSAIENTKSKKTKYHIQKIQVDSKFQNYLIIFISAKSIDRQQFVGIEKNIRFLKFDLEEVVWFAPCASDLPLDDNLSVRDTKRYSIAKSKKKKKTPPKKQRPKSTRSEQEYSKSYSQSISEDKKIRPKKRVTEMPKSTRQILKIKRNESEIKTEFSQQSVKNTSEIIFLNESKGERLESIGDQIRDATYLLSAITDGKRSKNKLEAHFDINWNKIQEHGYSQYLRMRIMAFIDYQYTTIKAIINYE